MKSWVKFGLVWGVFMFIMLNIVFPLLDGAQPELIKVLIGLPFWIIAGLIFGYVSRKRTKTKQD
ncbi:hypothetical protein CHU92_01540 [Flavobacterium cyanobacteriorum]|uniref:Uncharacterized protein n=1 Tax=Flavobacterium cyanobacteriorum TaxID=2022802 RepID=A0A255ZZM2_9FLAO|nr:hypothetical protein CHU92_01540 [Flavobacterium cyanobacteriorum]